MTELSGREIVRRCITFRDPPRVAMDFLTAPIGGRTWAHTDFAMVGLGADPDFKPTRPGENEFGIVYETFDATGENFGQAKAYPLAVGWEALDTYRWPDFGKPGRYAGFKERVAAQHAAGKYVIGSMPPLMMLATELRGMENWLTDNLLEPERLHDVLRAIMRIRRQVIDAYHAAGADAIITWDDMGLADREFVREDVFRDIYFPYYKETGDLLHDRGMHYIHHCCGMVRRYLDLFHEAGLDVLQLDQPALMGIDWLAEHYGGTFTFWCPTDIQKTAPTGDLEAIRDEAHHLCWAFGQTGGGFMVKAYAQPNAVGISVAAAEAQYQAFRQFGTYPMTPYARRAAMRD
ncbi:MAG: hypothetical protein K8T26_18805 [Lentisphaerae bacterium]|nr:hypothetical protein [Lentisphaerota bacterium]